LLFLRDFNLDEKIDALPSLSLEEFQQKKKAKKKRSASAPTTPKKHSARDRGGESTPGNLFLLSNWQPLFVGDTI
jgi:hypothetical protein